MCISAVVSFAIWNGIYLLTRILFSNNISLGSQSLDLNCKRINTRRWYIWKTQFDSLMLYVDFRLLILFFVAAFVEFHLVVDVLSLIFFSLALILFFSRLTVKGCFVLVIMESVFSFLNLTFHTSIGINKCVCRAFNFPP